MIHTTATPFLHFFCKLSQTKGLLKGFEIYQLKNVFFFSDSSQKSNLKLFKVRVPVTVPLKTTSVFYVQPANQKDVSTVSQEQPSVLVEAFIELNKKNKFF